MRYVLSVLNEIDIEGLPEKLIEWESKGWEFVDKRVGPDVDEKMTRYNIFIFFPDRREVSVGDIIDYWDNPEIRGRLGIGNKQQIKYRDALNFIEMVMIRAGRVDEYIEMF